jgi:transcription initiation factor TFIIA small subunit
MAAHCRALQGHLHTYRYCDQVWTFVVENAIVKTDNQEEHVDKLKIVAIDAKVGQLASR